MPKRARSARSTGNAAATPPMGHPARPTPPRPGSRGAQSLSQQLGQSVVVENRTGASGAIGTQHVAQSVPDGYTLLLVAAPFTTVSAVLPSAGYDPVTSFTPISMVAQGPLMWACNKDLPVQTLAELVAYAKARPGQLNYGSAGAGGINHLVLEQLKARTGVSIVHIPYRGIAPATLDMIGGQIHLITGTIPALAPFVRDGRIKPLAVTTAQRHQALPQVPGLLELGLADLPELPCTPEGAVRLKNGNPGMVFSSTAQYGDEAWASYQGRPVAVGIYKAGELHPSRVFNLD